MIRLLSFQFSRDNPKVDLHKSNVWQQKQQHHGISVWQYKLQNLESFRNLNPFDTLMGHAAYVIFCQADRVGRAGLCLG